VWIIAAILAQRQFLALPVLSVKLVLRVYACVRHRAYVLPELFADLIPAGMLMGVTVLALVL
jgi:hypothetical protein